MSGDDSRKPRAAPAPSGRGAALFALLVFLSALAIAVTGLYILTSFWLANLTVREWREAPAGSQLEILFDEPAHPPWSW